MYGKKIQHRGSPINPVNRFTHQYVEEDLSELLPEDIEDRPKQKTIFYADHADKIISYNSSPDIPFEASINPYRGCEHGCAYCYARPSHEYLDLSAGIDFETKIFYKKDIGKKLEKTFKHPTWIPQPIMLSGNTDPYQPAEKRFKLTRTILETVLQYRNPVSIITKNKLILRDIDLLKELSKRNLVHVTLSVTSIKPEIARSLEPRTSLPRQRLETVQKLSENGISCGVMMAPIIPGLTEEEIPALLQSAKDHGAMYAGMVMLRLPYAVKDIFGEWLEEHYPLKKDKVLNLVRSVRGGKLNDSDFKNRMRGTGTYAEHIRQLFRKSAVKAGFKQKRPALSTSQFQVPGRGKQMTMF